MDLSEIRKKLEPLKKNKKIAGAYVFGSYLKSPQEARDIDICILSKGLSLDEITDILGQFERPVDISFIERMRPYIAIRVLREGRPLFVSNSSLYSEIWLGIVRPYLRHQPMREHIYRGVRKWMSLQKPQTA